MLGDLEGFVCHVNPEIVVLLLVMVGSRGVADDAETYERNVVDVASLSNSYRFHIASKSFREVVLDAVDFILGADELIARTDKACVDGGIVECECCIHEALVGFEIGRHTLHLPVLATHTDVEVVMHSFCANYYIHNVET